MILDSIASMVQELPALHHFLYLLYVVVCYCYFFVLMLCESMKNYKCLQVRIKSRCMHWLVRAQLSKSSIDTSTTNNHQRKIQNYSPFPKIPKTSCSSPRDNSRFQHSVVNLLRRSTRSPNCVGKNGFALLAVTANVYEPAPACCSFSDTNLPIIEHVPKVQVKM